MLRRRIVLGLVVASLVGGFWLVQALAQQERPRDETRQRPERRRDETRQRGDREARMQEFRQRMQDRMRERLGASEEEWKVLQPRIEKVQQLQRQTRGGSARFAGRIGRRGRRPANEQRPEGAPEREQTEVQKKTEALRNLLEDEASGPEAVKAALEALRKARQKAQQDLAAAQKELKEVVTMRQEAQLLLMGIVD